MGLFLFITPDKLRAQLLCAKSIFVTVQFSVIPGDISVSYSSHCHLGILQVKGIYVLDICLYRLISYSPTTLQHLQPRVRYGIKCLTFASQLPDQKPA